MRLDSALKTVMVLAGLILIVAGLKMSGAFFLPMLTALFLAVISTPVVHFLERRAKMPSPVAITLTLLLDMGLLAGFVALCVTSFSGFHEALPRYQIALTNLVEDAAQSLEASGWITSDEDPLAAIRSAQSIFGVATDLAWELAEILGNVLLVSLLLGFFLFETRSAREKLGTLLGRANPHIEKFAHAASEVQRYLVVKTILSVLTAILSGCWFEICGVDFPLLWALLTFLLNYLPTVGPAISLVPPVVIALLTMGPGSAAAVAAGHLSIGFVIGNLLEPRMMGQTLGLSTLVVFVSMLFWGWIWGPIGALFSAPLTLMLRSTLETQENTRWIALLLGSREYVEEKRREWGWQTVEERAQGIPAPPPRSSIPPPPPRDKDRDAAE